MTFSNKAVQAASVLISSNLESIETFLAGGEVDEDVVFVGTHNSNLINLEHSADSKSFLFKLQFVDSGGDAIQKLFPLSLPTILRKREEDTPEGLFYITYGMGADRNHWCGPITLFISGATYEVKPTGLDITTLEFSFSYLLASKKDYKRKKNKLLGDSKSPLVQETDDAAESITMAKFVEVNIGTHDSKFLTDKILTSEKLVGAISELVRGTSQAFTNLQTIVSLPKKEMIDYLDSWIPDHIVRSEDDAKFMYLTNNEPPILGQGISPDGATTYMYQSDDGTVLVDYKDGLSTLAIREHLKELGIEYLYKKQGKSRAKLALEKKQQEKIDAEYSALPISARPYVTPRDNMHAPGVAAAAAPETVEYIAPPHRLLNDLYIEDIFITFDELYKTGTRNFILGGLTRLFSAIRRRGGAQIELIKGIETNVDILRVWKEQGHIKFIAPTMILGDKVTINEDFYGDIPKSEEADRASGSAEKLSSSAKKKVQSVVNKNGTVEDDYALEKEDKELEISHIFESGKDILSFKGEASTPALAFLAPDIQFLNNTKLTRQEIVDYLENKLSDILGRDPFESNTADRLEYHNFAKLAETIYDDYFTKHDSSSELNIRGASDLGGLLSFAYMYTKLLVMGGISAKIQVTPKFEYSTGYDLTRTVGVKLRKNPSLYDKLSISNYNSYWSGYYRILGFSHKISNDFAQSTFDIQKIYFGDDVTKSSLDDDVTFDAKPNDVRGSGDEAGATDLGPKRQEDSLLDLYDRGLGPEYGDYKA